jgi:tetratricopeptide (TPR) repeat protein
MNREITPISFYMKLVILLLFFGLFGCSTTEVVKGDMNGYPRNDLSGDSRSSQTGMSSETATQAFASGLQAQERGDVDKALYYYIQTLQFDATNVDALIRIAHIHEQKGNRAIATKAYLEAIKNDPTLILAYQGLGVIEMENRQYKQAKEYLQQAIALDQTRISEQEGKKDAGYYPLDKNSPVKSYTVSGVIEDIYSNFDLARIYYNLALDINPNSANILSNIGYSYYLTGNLKLAESYFRRAINADALFTRAWTNLGLVYVRKGQYNRAIKTFKQVMTEFDAYNDLGYFVMLDGRLDEAEYFFKKAIDMSPRYFAKAYANLEQVRIKKRELWLLQQEAQGLDVAKPKSGPKAKAIKVTAPKAEPKAKAIKVAAPKSEPEAQVMEVVAPKLEPEALVMAVATLKSEVYTQAMEVAETEPEAQVMEVAEPEPEGQVMEVAAPESKPKVQVMEVAESEPEVQVMEVAESEPEVQVVKVAESEPEAQVIEVAETELETQAMDVAAPEPKPKVQVVKVAAPEPKPEVQDLEVAEPKLDPEAQAMEVVESETDSDNALVNVAAETALENINN